MTFAMMYKRFANPGETPEEFFERWTTEQQQLKDGDIYDAEIPNAA